MNDPLNPGDPGGTADQDQTDGGDLTAYRTGAMTSQSDIDKAKVRYGSALGSNYRAEETGWDGLTKEQEIQQRLWHERAIAIPGASTSYLSKAASPLASARFLPRKAARECSPQLCLSASVAPRIVQRLSRS